MSTTFNFPPVTREDGTSVELDQLVPIEPQPVRFSYAGFNGLTAFCDPSKADIVAVLHYRAELARIQRERIADEDEEAVEEIEAIAEKIEGKLVSEARELVGAENYRRVMRHYNLQQLDEVANAEILDPIRARIVAPCVVAWNVPGEGDRPSDDAFTRNGLLISTVLPALWRFYRPFMNGSAATIVTDPTATTPTSQNEATATESSKPTPSGKETSPSGRKSSAPPK